MDSDFILIFGQEFYQFSSNSPKKGELWKSLENLKVSHTTFGDGQILKIDKHINIYFSKDRRGQERKFTRLAFENGFIKSILIPKSHDFYESLKIVEERRVRREKELEEEIIRLYLGQKSRAS